MTIDIRQLGPEALALVPRVPIRFRVTSVLRIEEVDGGFGGFRLVEETLEEPYVKDYDAYDPDEFTNLPKQFDLLHWAFFIAFDGDAPVGAATVAFDTPGLDMLEGRKDLAVLWDIRVHPDRRGEGIGAALFDRVVDWSRERGCVALKIETQNVNVRACRFYAKMDCRLRAIDRFAYARDPRVAHETMLLWQLDLRQ